jgi:hypothetical protein
MGKIGFYCFPVELYAMGLDPWVRLLIVCDWYLFFFHHFRKVPFFLFEASIHCLKLSSRFVESYQSAHAPFGREGLAQHRFSIVALRVQ